LSVVLSCLWPHPYSLCGIFQVFVRFFSAIVFVLSSEFILEYLEQNNMLQFGGVIYSGIGGGMAFSGLTVPFLSKFVGASTMWLCLGLLSLIPMFIAIYAMPKITIKRYLQSADVKGIKKEIILLGASYFWKDLHILLPGHLSLSLCCVLQAQLCFPGMYGYLQVSEQFSLHHFGWLCIKGLV